MKVALVCDWLTNVGGAERVLLAFHQLYPSAPIYTSQYNKKGIAWFDKADVRTGWLQIFPSRLRRFLAPLRSLYFKHLDLSAYDLIISVTGAEAKAVKKGQAQHICYCHVPTQYYWQMYDDYIKNPGFGILDPLVRLCLKLLIKPLRQTDFKAAQKPDQFITISSYAAAQIKTFYGREATIIAPPVEVERFAAASPANSTPSHDAPFITTARQVTWKRLDLAIKACLATQQPLILIGEGPEHRKLVKLAHHSPLIKFLPLTDQKHLKKHLNQASAYLFPSLEPFGIAPVEALAAGCPVIAYSQGGSRDFIRDQQNGLLFNRQSVASLAAAIQKFHTLTFNRRQITKSALPFSKARFTTQIKQFIEEHYDSAKT